MGVGKELPIVARLQGELSELKRELSVEIPKQLEEARAHGDLRENAEYHATKERQSLLHARIGQIQHRIGELSMFSKTSIPTDRAGYGSRLEVEDVESGDIVVYHLVFPEEADPSKGKVSMSSPVGRAFLNRRPGDEVAVATPTGRRSFEIVELETIHEREEQEQEQDG